ncbi:uncharacterized protein [Hyperolius riggenbachi]|uniref:uncharacterized protein n=1 Tax=Hyperolius riggenbachi TaxID=752182 RepID=UPI0035A269E7
MTEASRLGCGGIIVRLQEVGDNVRSLVVEGQRSGLHLVLDIEVSEEYNSSQVQTMKEALHSWIQDGVSGFSLSGGQRSSLRMVSQFLQEDMDIVAREDRFILLPDWLCEETASNKSVLLCTCSLPRWDSAKVTECSQVQNTAWQVSSGSSLELRQFMAATLPGTAILPLSQTQPPPSWLELLLFRRHQHPALYAGWLQPMADNSTYGIVHRWGCSTLLVAINPTNQPRNLSVRLTGYKATAQLLLSTTWRRSRDLNVQEGLLLAPGEAQLLRLTLEEL